MRPRKPSGPISPTLGSLVLTLAIGATLTGIIFMMTEQNGS